MIVAATCGLIMYNLTCTDVSPIELVLAIAGEAAWTFGSIVFVHQATKKKGGKNDSQP